MYHTSSAGSYGERRPGFLEALGYLPLATSSASAPPYFWSQAGALALLDYFIDLLNHDNIFFDLDYPLAVVPEAPAGTLDFWCHISLTFVVF
jgi:hypothetical protein